MDHYILVNREPEAVPLMEWARWLEGDKTKRIVKQTKIGDVSVSTVFLGIDHRFGKGPPILFETMVFGGPLDQGQARYATWDEATHGHAEMVERVKS